MLERSTKIIILLIIDILFFLIELIVGYAVGSLALVADSFHMLNDVMSLIVALYAIKLANKSASTSLTYGWHRAEILAALINGVFLLALCFSIFMEAIERFFEVPEITNPMLVVIVGCFGLASNILGLFLFHEHGHDHGHEHGHGEEDNHAHAHSRSIDSSGPKLVASPMAIGGDGERQPLLMNGSTTPPMSPTLSVQPRPRSSSIDSISLFGHPVQNRAYVIAKAQDLAVAGSLRASSPPVSSALHRRSTSLSLHRASSSLSNAPGSTSVEPAQHDHIHEEDEEAETTPNTPVATKNHIHERSHSHDLVRDSSRHADIERGHSGGGHGHHHGSMNMRALLLHVLGDALGNVGVISSGLIIWQTTWKYRYYSDPVISLLITIIIFSSALPLVKSASFILLQGVPENINVDVLCGEIEKVEGVISVHELHVWQLSETKHIASVHIQMDKRSDYMGAVHQIRRILHRHNIHNATIQPEFGGDGTQYTSSCLVACPPGKDCSADQMCCPTVPAISVVHHD